MTMPIPPSPPDYDKIIEEELIKIGDYTLVRDINLRKKLEKAWEPYKNPAYNDARVESFEASVKSRILVEYNKYCRRLKEYELNLERYQSELEERINAGEKQMEDIRTDFDTAKTFYNGFQKLVEDKNKQMNSIVKGIFKMNQEDNDEDSEEV